MTEKLGHLERAEIRNTWETEDRHFTPWLTEEENLQILSDTVGIELELEATEHNVGPFRADILCKNTLDGSWVLIENQIEKTDHKHLGQLLTYASGLKAITMIWIASKFTEEHRSALDWLNTITDDNFHFFGLEIEVWRIDNSRPAPKFNIVSNPNEWNATVTRSTQAQELKPLQNLQLEYWTNLSEHLKGHYHPPLNIGTPRPQGWSDFALGRTHAVLRLSMNDRDGKLASGIYLSKSMRDKYDQLYAQKESIEANFGATLIWENSQNSQTAVIKIEKQTNFRDKENWPKLHSWHASNLASLYQVFRPLLEKN